MHVGTPTYVLAARAKMSQDKPKTSSKTDLRKGSTATVSGHIEATQIDPSDKNKNADDVKESVSEEWCCPNCNVKYGTVGEQYWLECTICLKHYDTDCLKMPKKHWQTVNARKDIQWLCSDCMSQHLPDPSKGLVLKNITESDPSKMNDNKLGGELKKIAQKIDSIVNGQKEIMSQLENAEEALDSHITEMNKDLPRVFEKQITRLGNTLGSQINDIKNEVPSQINDNINNKMEIVPQQIETNITKWSDLFKNSATETNKQVVSSVRQALSDQVKIDKENEERSRSVVLFKAKVGQSESDEGRRQEDELFIKEFLAEIDSDTTTFSRFDRLGKYNSELAVEGKARPLKVRFNTKEDKDEVLGKLRNLAKASDAFRKISVKHDMSQSEREQIKVKINECKEKTANSEKYAYLVRGPPWNLRILEVPKKGHRQQKN